MRFLQRNTELSKSFAVEEIAMYNERYKVEVVVCGKVLYMSIIIHQPPHIVCQVHTDFN